MNIIPLPYAIPDEYIVTEVPNKVRLFSEVVPGRPYSYKTEDEYLQQYRESRFAITCKKGGWDCLRHYEILAAGCIPVFPDLDSCPTNTMITFPKALIKEACQALIPWDDSKEELYRGFVLRLLDHCRAYCSTSALAKRFLSHFPGATRILLIQTHPGENYTRELLSIGLRRELRENFVDYPRINVLYTDCDLTTRYGKGFTYGGKFADSIDRSSIEDRIKDHYFDVIIYGKVGRDEIEGTNPMAFWPAVSASYKREEIAFLYGGDGCQNLRDTGSSYTRHLLAHAPYALCFVRELL